ncbi:MgtC/SapB family protein [Facklamia sp. 7083-14-GEN3]|uniref:MgtC/SapB family protein n=1 Tax=Facklamia sp. 7083-14-GEN3 TaxID=2973478 RepID=UPI00215CC518|nr:MgtC/SapB family protein [Facklamia sp. 7083-14-GEN3]MCR8969617.1 MgtC/SapB family protein [Facklamia sp. 7083-14-GEN3]
MNLPAINFEELNFFTILFRSILAMLISGMIGFERGLKNHPAGMRTYILVCVTSAMVMMTNQFAAEFFEGADPTRMGSQVVSGIGFLGAGMILVTNRDKIKGLTTAAGLWSSACIGLAIGIGFYEVAIVVGIILLITLTVLQRVESSLRKKAPWTTVFIQAKDVESFNEVLHFIEASLINISFIKPLANNSNQLDYLVRMVIPNEVNIEKFFKEINQVSGIRVYESEDEYN